jgi:hypothetical protein
MGIFKKEKNVFEEGLGEKMVHRGTLIKKCEG